MMKTKAKSKISLKKEWNQQEPVIQENSMGCGVACVAFRCGLPYQEALKLFEHPENAWGRGFYCEEIVSALKKCGLKYEYSKFKASHHQSYLQRDGTIVFTEPNSNYAFGHYLVRTPKGWMNPWFNHPRMHPAEAAISSRLPGEVSYIIFQSE